MSSDVSNTTEFSEGPMPPRFDPPPGWLAAECATAATLWAERLRREGTPDVE